MVKGQAACSSASFSVANSMVAAAVFEMGI
jgi:hypothetical protein